MSSGSGNITSSAFSPVKDSTTAAWHSLFLFSFLCFAFLLASFRLLLTPLFFECLPVAQTPSLAALWYFPDYLPEYGLIINASWRGGGGGGSKTFTCSSWGRQKKLSFIIEGGTKSSKRSVSPLAINNEHSLTLFCKCKLVSIRTA